MQVTVVYSRATDPVSGTNTANYQIESATVLGTPPDAPETSILLYQKST
jgi:hypothetical protein